MRVCPQIPEEVFEEVLLSALQTDLASAFSTPEQLQLLLVALQRFPQTLKPKKLKKLLGSSTIINKENIPKYGSFSWTVTCLCHLFTPPPFPKSKTWCIIYQLSYLVVVL